MRVPRIINVVITLTFNVNVNIVRNMYQVVTTCGGFRKCSNKIHPVSGRNFTEASVTSFEITESHCQRFLAR